MSSSSWVECRVVLQVEVLGVLDALDEVRLLKAVVALDATLHEDLKRGAGTGSEALRREWGKVGCEGQGSWGSGGGVSQGVAGSIGFGNCTSEVVGETEEVAGAAKKQRSMNSTAEAVASITAAVAVAAAVLVEER